MRRRESGRGADETPDLHGRVVLEAPAEPPNASGVRPPMLTDGARTGRYRTGVDLPIRLWSRISRADLASFLIDEAGRSAFLGSFPRIAA